MKEKITIGFLTAKNPFDKRSWSGTYYKMYETLKNQVDEVILIAPIKKSSRIKLVLLINSTLNFLISFKKFKKNHSILLSKYYASKIKSQLKNKKINVLFAPAASTEIAFLKTSIPICYLSDTSFAQISEYYSSFSNISKASCKQANIIEQRAIDNSTTQVYSSNWAAEFVLKNYNTNKKNVFIVNFGANLDFIPLKENLQREYDACINLLFLGVNWKRKGGDIALEAFNILIKKGYNVSLTICGCKPPNLKNTANTKVIPFLNKNNTEEYEEFLSILYNTHLLVVPTRADCTPIVFCEANAFGIPVITTNTGGVSSIIENDINGYALPYEANAVEYAHKIQELLDNRAQLKKLASTAREKFEKELNWEVWGTKMKEILSQTAKSTQHQSDN